MKCLCYTALLAVLLLQGCGHAEQHNQKIKTLDSLNGVLNLKVKELENTDTAILMRCIARFNYYSQFVKQNINDTVTRHEADNLQHFYLSGKALENFQKNRLTLLARAALINSQQKKLGADIKNHALEPAQAEQYISVERQATSLVIEAASTQQRQFYSGIEEFKTSLREVEVLIRSRNNGELPTIVKDTSSL